MKKLFRRSDSASINNIYKLDGRVPVLKAIPFGLQHVLAMFVANIAPIYIVAGACGLTAQDTASGYYKFSLGGKETYVRISSSNNCITKDEQTAFINAHTEHFGYIADVTGIVSLYSGNFYLIPATEAPALANFARPTRTDAEKI